MNNKIKRFHALFYAFVISIAAFADGILIGDIYYKFSGSDAIVTYKRQGLYSDSWGRCYTNQSYTIPSEVTYNGLTYNVTKIDDRAFGNTSPELNGSSLSYIYLPNSVTTIGYAAFYNCKNLVKITIPSSVTSMSTSSTGSGQNTFYGCTNLRQIIYTSSTAPSGWVATSSTYVPNLSAYTSPPYTVNTPKVIEMITWSNTNYTYDGKSIVLPSFTNNLANEGFEVSMNTTNVVLPNKKGTYTVYIPTVFTSQDETFEVEIPFKYTVQGAPLTIIADNAERLYGDSNPEFTYTVEGFVNGEDESCLQSLPTLSSSAEQNSSVGTYTITATDAQSDYYTINYIFGTLTINKAPLSARVNDATKVYGAQNPAFTIDYYGLKNDESVPTWTTSPTFQTDATQASGVGAYPVKAVNGVPINYDLGEITAGTLNITPAPLTIKANDAVRQYYSDDPIFSYKCDGFVNGDNESVLSTTPTLTTTATRSSNVGTYEIKVGETSNPNYSISYINGTLTITPRTLIASVGNYERLYNEENPVFEVKYDGFVGKDNENGLISKPEAKTTATKTSDVGTYPINVTGGSADNYTFSYTSGILTINKAEQTLYWEQDLSDLSVDDQVELKAEASSGLPITYTMDQTNIAEIYSTGKKYYLDCKNEGTFQIVAAQNGNKNYYSSTRVRKTVTIGNSSGINEIDNSPVKLQKTSYGIKVIDANVGDVIRVYTLDGLLQYSIRVDSKNVDIPLKGQDGYIIKVGGKTVKLGL